MSRAVLEPRDLRKREADVYEATSVTKVAIDAIEVNVRRFDTSEDEADEYEEWTGAHLTPLRGSIHMTTIHATPRL